MKTEGKHSRGEAEKPKKNKKMPVGRMILLDLTVIAVGLCAFAFVHLVLPRRQAAVPVLLAPTPQPTVETTAVPAAQETDEQTATAAPEETVALPEETPEPVRVYSGMWGEKFADKFTEGEVIRTENSYQSENVNVSLERFEEDGVIYYVADIYISDLKYLHSGFANGAYNGGFQMLGDMAHEAGAIVALSGDHYGGRYEGIVVRDGVLYRDTRFADVCVLLNDGTMVTLENDELDLDDLKAAAPYQVWSFGPELLDEEGKAMTRFNSMVLPNNPRAAIGYVEPGHYYFVEVEGSRTGAWSGSRGMKMEELSRLFESLGCASAYNLDGGSSAGLAWMGELKSYPYGRSIPDMIYIVDDVPLEQTEGD